MSVKLQMDGLAEFRRALRNLPADLTEEASAIVLAHAEEADRQITNAYPEGPTGNLKRGVTTERNTSRFSTSAIVRSRAKHAWIFENGTRLRKTRQGASRGVMPAAQLAQKMIPIVIRRRRAMVQALIQLVRRAGFEVDA